MNFDEPSSVCSVSSSEIEAARLASERPSLTQNGLAFLNSRDNSPTSESLLSGNRSR